MKNKILLYSGGMDSWLINKIWKPDVLLYVDLNGRYNAEEMKHLPPECKVVKLDLSEYEREDKIIPLRNLYLIMLASNYLADEGGEICLGATAGDRVLDKSYAFAEKASDILSYLYSEQWWNPIAKEVKVCLDFKDKTKVDLVNMYVQMGGSVDEVWEKSFSCYEPNEDGTVCYACKPCFRKAVACWKAGFTNFSSDAVLKLHNYIGVEIIPDINAGTYGRGEKEEQEIKDFYNWLSDKVTETYGF